MEDLLNFPLPNILPFKTNHLIPQFYGEKNLQEGNINPILLSPWVGRKHETKAFPVDLNRLNTETKA